VFIHSFPLKLVIRSFLCLGFLALVLSGCQGLQNFDLFAFLASPTPTASLTFTPTVTFSPTVTLSPAPTSTITPTPSWTPTFTYTPTPSETPTISLTPTETATPGPSLTPTISLTPSHTPTPTRSLTPTRTNTRTRIPTFTHTPSKTPTITLTPTMTFTPTPPVTHLRITKPGLESKVHSPIPFEAFTLAGDDGLVHIDLLGEDSRVITSLALDYRQYRGTSFWIDPKIYFSITAAAETGRLLLYINDLFGRKIALTSVDLILISVGDNEINPPYLYWEPYLIRYPAVEQVIQGGTVPLVGLARPVNDQPLIIELIDEHGNVVGSTQIHVDPPRGDLSHTPFQVGIPYTISARTPVRLTIRQESDQRIPGTIQLVSRPIILDP